MSAIWSASSRTVMATSERLTSPRPIRSSSRPGVATRTSVPRRTALACLLIDMPPTTVVIRRLTAVAYGVSASVTCWASSRVGTRTSASGYRATARFPAVRASSGRPKARVLPEPVRPRPSTSRPAIESGSVAPWIGKGSVTPWRPRAERIPLGSSSSAKVAAGGREGVAWTTVNSAASGTAVRACLGAPERPRGLRGAPPPAARRVWSVVRGPRSRGVRAGVVT